jgi:hypothetical protein
MHQSIRPLGMKEWMVAKGIQVLEHPPYSLAVTTLDQDSLKTT